MQLIAGTTIADRFRLVRELGRGGMGAVWLAEHISLETFCAVKFIDREGKNAKEARQRFQREARAAAQLRSPHVVQILDHGVWENFPYIAMEYLQGEDLAHRLDRVGRLSWGETYRIAAHVARALTKAHAASIVHRDMKPANVFLARDDETEIAKVLDFGIAKQAGMHVAGDTTKPGSILGTPYYMSPEQARGNQRVDHRSDLFSFAVIVYQCLTGALPFYSEGLGDTLAQIMYEPLPVPSARASDLPPEFDEWWQRAASRDVETRFQSAKEFVEALRLALQLSDVFEIQPIALTAEGRDSYPRGDSRPSGSILHDQTMALPIPATIDEPFARTFGPDPPQRRRRQIVVGGVVGALALSGAVFYARGAFTPSPARLAPPGIAAHSANVAAPEAAVEAVPPPKAPLEGAARSALPVSSRGQAIDNGPAAAGAAARKPKATKPARTKRDYGI